MAKTPVRYVLFSGGAELEGVGYVHRLDADRPVLINSQDRYQGADLELEMYQEGGVIVVKTNKGEDKFALASGVVRQWR